MVSKVVLAVLAQQLERTENGKRERERRAETANQPWKARGKCARAPPYVRTALD